MDTQNILEQLFFIYHQLEPTLLDSYFKEIGYQHIYTDNEGLSYEKKEGPDGGRFAISIKTGKIITVTFYTLKNIDYEIVYQYAKIKNGFDFDQEPSQLDLNEEQSIVLSNAQLQLSAIKSYRNFQELTLNTPTYMLSLYKKEDITIVRMKITPPFPKY
jgi:hypothetical protein